MPHVTLTNDQVVALVEQLPPEQTSAAQTRRAERQGYAEGRLRTLATERSLDWEALDEDAREEFVDDLLHEER